MIWLAWWTTSPHHVDVVPLENPIISHNFEDIYFYKTRPTQKPIENGQYAEMKQIS